MPRGQVVCGPASKIELRALPCHGTTRGTSRAGGELEGHGDTTSEGTVGEALSTPRRLIFEIRKTR